MLPTKWQIKITPENKDILREYWLTLNPDPDYLGLEQFYGFMLSDRYDGTYLHYDTNDGRGGYEEINLDTFGQYVLNSFDPEDWNIEVSTKEQFNEVMDFIRPNDSAKIWKRPDCGFGNKARFIYKRGSSSSYNHSATANFPVEKRISWEQFQTLKNKNMKYTIQDLNKYSYQTGNNIVVHITTSGQHARLQKVCPKMANFNSSKSYYLTSDYGYAETPYYKTIEFSDIDLGEKIIGYKVPMDLWNGTIKKGEILIKSETNEFAYKVDNTHRQKINTDSFPKEIVETWEPVYEEVIKSETISLGIPIRVFTVYKDLIEMKDGDGEIRNYSTADLESLLVMFNRKVWNGVNINMASVQLGCSAGTELRQSDLLKIQEIQTKLNG